VLIFEIEGSGDLSPSFGQPLFKCPFLCNDSEAALRATACWNRIVAPHDYFSTSRFVPKPEMLVRESEEEESPWCAAHRSLAIDHILSADGTLHKWGLSKDYCRSAICFSALPNDEAQTPRWGCPNSVVFSQTLRVIGVVCSAWFAVFFFTSPSTR
jgi:hypothetical protein